MSRQQWIDDEVNDVAEEWGVAQHRAWPAWCLKYVHGIEGDEALAQTDTLAGAVGGDGGLDGWWRDSDNKEFHLWQCKWTAQHDRVHDRSSGVELIDAAEALLDADQAAARGPGFAQVGGRVRRCIETDYDLVLNIGVRGRLSEQATTQLHTRVAGMSDRIAGEIRLQVWDDQEFQSEAEQRHPTNETLVGVEVPVTLQSPAVLKIDAADPTLPTPWEALVASLNASSLGDAASEHGMKLFSLNVRYSLGSNRRIKNMHKSLVDDSDNKYFWLYNNGITIICDDFRVDTDGDKPQVILTNPQVVNGCQTITAFLRRRGEYSHAPSVLARIIKPPSDGAGREKALLIAERTNSQNEVKARDLKSTAPVQQRLAVAFDQMTPPWFYERKRGEWNSIGRRRKAEYRTAGGLPAFGIGTRRIDMERAGQSFRMLFAPSAAITRKREMFDDDDTYGWLFHARRSPEHYLCAFLLRHRFEALWHHNQADALIERIGRHAKPELMRRMLRGKGQMVAHSMALTRMLLQKEEPDAELGSQQWELEDARTMTRFAASFDPVANRWLGLLFKAFKDLLPRDDDADDTLSFKKKLERPQEVSLAELWENISESAAFLAGPDWRKQSREQIVAQLADSDGD